MLPRFPQTLNRALVSRLRNRWVPARSSGLDMSARQSPCIKTADSGRSTEWACSGRLATPKRFSQQGSRMKRCRAWRYSGSGTLPAIGGRRGRRGRMGATTPAQPSPGVPPPSFGSSERFFRNPRNRFPRTRRRPLLIALLSRDSTVSSICSRSFLSSARILEMFTQGEVYRRKMVGSSVGRCKLYPAKPVTYR